MNILLTSVGRRTYLVKYFKKELEGKGNLFVSNSDSDSPAFQFADHSVVSPLIYDNEYIPFLLDYCESNDIQTVIPLFDLDVYILSKNKKKFSNQGIRILVGEWGNIEFCNDKYLTFQKLKSKQFNVPITALSLSEAKEMLDNNLVEFPLIIKPRWGMGSIGIYEADNFDEATVFYNKVMRDIQGSYLKYESNIDLQNSIIIQEKIKAVEYGLDVINDLDGNYQTTIVKKKKAMRAGETDSAIVIDSYELKEIGKRLSDIVKHPGNLDVDVLFDGQKYFVLELNARFGGGYPFTHLSGVNLPKAIVKWLGNETLTNELVEEFDVAGYKDIEIKKKDD